MEANKFPNIEMSILPVLGKREEVVRGVWNFSDTACSMIEKFSLTMLSPKSISLFPSSHLSVDMVFYNIDTYVCVHWKERFDMVLVLCRVK